MIAHGCRNLFSDPVRPDVCFSDVVVKDLFPADVEPPPAADGAMGSEDAEVAEEAAQDEFPVRVRRGPPEASKAMKDQHRATCELPPLVWRVRDGSREG